MQKIFSRGIRLLEPSLTGRWMSSNALASKFADLNEVKALWKRADAVCFDVDSTVIDGEGIDVLADFCGKGKEVAEWTANAMTGSVPFHTGIISNIIHCFFS